jgi:hypothetical protein
MNSTTQISVIIVGITLFILSLLWMAYRRTRSSYPQPDIIADTKNCNRLLEFIHYIGKNTASNDLNYCENDTIDSEEKNKQQIILHIYPQKNTKFLGNQLFDLVKNFGLQLNRSSVLSLESNQLGDCHLKLTPINENYKFDNENLYMINHDGFILSIDEHHKKAIRSLKDMLNIAKYMQEEWSANIRHPNMKPLNNQIVKSWAQYLMQNQMNEPKVVDTF